MLRLALSGGDRYIDTKELTILQRAYLPDGSNSNACFFNSTNFPDPNFRAALAERLNVNEGDKIYPNNVTVLDVSNKGISDLTGIEHFTNLEELYAQNNSITSTNPSSNINVESNTKLKILNASNNSSLTHVAGIAN